MRPMTNPSAGSTTAPTPTPTTTPTVTTYTIDASNATVTKAGVASNVAGIAVGDMISVQGTVNGTSVTATKINDGMMKMGNKMQGMNGMGMSAFNGNGQPIIGGKVTAVNGNSVSITNSSNTTYTIDVTNAKLTTNGQASTAGSIAVGDNVLAQGTVNGTSVTAVTLVDQGQKPTSTNPSTAGTPAPAHQGFFGAIGGFFAHLFGF